MIWQPPRSITNAVKDALLEPKGEHSAEKPAAPPSGPDVFGALQDSPAEKHDLKEPEKALPPAGDSLGTPPGCVGLPDGDGRGRRPRRRSPLTTRSIPPQHRRMTRCPTRCFTTPSRRRTPKNRLSHRKARNSSTRRTNSRPRLLPATCRFTEIKIRTISQSRSPVEPEHKPALAADHDAFGALKDASPPKPDEHEIKAAEPLNIAGDNPPNPVPHHRRRKKKSPEAELPAPGPALTAEPSPTTPLPPANRKKRLPSDVLPTLTGYAQVGRTRSATSRAQAGRD